MAKRKVPLPRRRGIEVSFGDRIYAEVIEDSLELSELTPDECCNALNRAVGKYAFYGALRADAKHKKSEIDTNYELWEAQKISEIAADPDYKELTSEKARKTQVVMDNTKTWKRWMSDIEDIQLVVDKLYVLINSIESMTKTIQSVLAMKRIELSTAQHSGLARGSGDLLEEQ